MTWSLAFSEGARIFNNSTRPCNFLLWWLKAVSEGSLRIIITTKRYLRICISFPLLSWFNSISLPTGWFFAASVCNHFDFLGDDATGGKNLTANSREKVRTKFFFHLVGFGRIFVGKNRQEVSHSFSLNLSTNTNNFAECSYSVSAFFAAVFSFSLVFLSTKFAVYYMQG